MTLEKAKEVLNIEAQAIKDVSKRLNREFLRAVELTLQCKGRVIVTGMGKTGIVGHKISSMLSSTGTPSIFMHSAEAVHGDLGQVTKNDILIIISNSGNYINFKYSHCFGLIDRHRPIARYLKHLDYLFAWIYINSDRYILFNLHIFQSRPCF